MPQIGTKESRFPQPCPRYSVRHGRNKVFWSVTFRLFNSCWTILLPPAASWLPLPLPVKPTCHIMQSPLPSHKLNPRRSIYNDRFILPFPSKVKINSHSFSEPTTVVNIKTQSLIHLQRVNLPSTQALSLQIVHTLKRNAVLRSLCTVRSYYCNRSDHDGRRPG